MCMWVHIRKIYIHIFFFLSHLKVNCKHEISLPWNTYVYVSNSHFCSLLGGIKKRMTFDEVSEHSKQMSLWQAYPFNCLDFLYWCHWTHSPGTSSIDICSHLVRNANLCPPHLDLQNGIAGNRTQETSLISSLWFFYTLKFGNWCSP